MPNGGAAVPVVDGGVAGGEGVDAGAARAGPAQSGAAAGARGADSAAVVEEAGGSRSDGVGAGGAVDAAGLGDAPGFSSHEVHQNELPQRHRIGEVRLAAAD